MFPNYANSLLIVLLLWMIQTSYMQDNYFSYPNLYNLRFVTGGTMGFYAAVIMPVTLKLESAYMGWFFEAIYKVPTNESSFEFPPLVERHIDRKFVYGVVQHKIETTGYPGKFCLLRTICELAIDPLHKTNGVIDDLIHIILTPSTTVNAGLPPEYVDAEIYGRKNGDCDDYHKNCSLSILDIISFVKEFPVN
ncbi:unnamed protein product [Phaedon cochleariae]|uniref:Uncharacterized protein n=1 Tax=Phaedon cochleariae TaxID=80249 RepID=A0A9N9SM02_PHACE|nr:unnamed protein product [Phaedon cochleariae]